MSRHPLPSTGSLGSVPPLRRYYGNARTPGHPSRLASFPSLGATTVRPLLSPLPPAWGATLQGRGLSRGSPSRSVGGNGWASQVPGGPSRACPALRPRRDRHAKPLRRVDVAFRNFGTRRLPPLSISGLNHTACALAVYASQPGSPLDHARLASGWGLALAGRVWLPARSLVKFPRYFMASSSPRLRLAHPKPDLKGVDHTTGSLQGSGQGIAEERRPTGRAQRERQPSVEILRASAGPITLRRRCRG